MLYIKIGATSEIPQKEAEKVAYMNDFWRTIYLKNNLCPGDIPFSIIIDEFVLALAHGVIDRKGNNQVAICNAFNEWVTRQDVRHRLYQKRDELYPEGKPKQIPKTSPAETVADYSNEELLQKYNAIKPMAGLRMVDEMIEKLKQEMNERGIEG
jgi:hypothetical protein